MKDSRTTTAREPRHPRASAGLRPAHGLLAVVGALALVEVTSGVLQGFYTPILPDLADRLRIADGDLNWFEAAQLVVMALLLPPLSRLGDVVGHRRVLLITTAVVAVGSWSLVLAPSFATFLIGFAVQGAYVVWLPIEVAIVFRRTADHPHQARATRRATGALVAALEVGIVLGAVTSGVLVEQVPMTVLLAIPAAAVTVCLLVILLLVDDVPGVAAPGIDPVGLGLVTIAVGLVLAGVVAIRVLGPGSALPWVALAAGLTVLVPFARHELGHAQPVVDVRLLGSGAQWPLHVASFLLGMSVLGAQIPLSTFVRTDPALVGHGLGGGAGTVAALIVLYVAMIAVGASLLPSLSHHLGARGALVAGALLVAAGYLLWLGLHHTVGHAALNLGVAGVGSGLLIAGLPVAAAAAAPPSRTGTATGMTSTTRTLGGAIASACFAVALTLPLDAGLEGDMVGGVAPLSGYLSVWSICAGSALLAAAALVRLPVGSTGLRWSKQEVGHG